MTTPSTSQEELVRAIADRLKPWNCSESHVLTEIRSAIRRLRAHPDFNPDSYPGLGFRSENKKCAKKMLVTVTTLERQLVAAKPGFFWSLTLRDKKLQCDMDGYGKKVTELSELLNRVTKLKWECEKVILNAPGAYPGQDYRQIHIAIYAIHLMLGLSNERPTAGTPDTPYCMIASLLFEATTGKSERNLLRTCKRMLASSDILADFPSSVG
jgi:hypothetical protein